MPRHADPVPTMATADENRLLCPRCNYTLDVVACSAYEDLWECAQCGYTKSLKQQEYRNENH